MRRLSLVIACSALALATAARAQTVIANPSAVSDGTFADHSFSQPPGTGDMSDSSGGLHYTSTFSLGSSISFESGNVAIGGSGNEIHTTSTSRIDLAVTNDTDVPLTTALKSQIIPAGMGFYLGGNSTSCFTAPATCGQAQTLDTFSSLSSTNAAGRTLGSVSVDFKIMQDRSLLDEFSGGLSIGLNADGAVFTTDLAGLSDLSGFTTGGLTNFGNPRSALGYAWDATDITENLNTIGALGGQSTISYIVTVQTDTLSNCLGDGVCLLAYAGFGDPIGRGGEISSAARFLGPTSLNFTGNPFITGVNFSPETFDLPHFDLNGNLVFAPGNGVPEPAVWMSLVMGFGLVGAALRRRRVLAYA